MDTQSLLRNRVMTADLQQSAVCFKQPRRTWKLKQAGPSTSSALHSSPVHRSQRTGWPLCSQGVWSGEAVRHWMVRGSGHAREAERTVSIGSKSSRDRSPGWWVSTQASHWMQPSESSSWSQDSRFDLMTPICGNPNVGLRVRTVGLI